MKKKRKKSALLGILIPLVLLGGGITFFVRRSQKAMPQEQIFTVREEFYRNVIEISGNIKAAQQQNIQAAGDGVVEAVFVREGDRVKAGQILFQLNDSQERYNLANHEFQMNQERINGASTRLTLMEEQRQVLLEKIRDRHLEARFDGIIGQLNLSRGDYAKAQDIFGYLIDRSYLKATVEVVETDAARLKAGQPVRLTFLAYPELRVEGVVVSYPAVGRIATRGATVLDTEIRINKPPEEILPGYSFTGEIIGGDEERVLTVESAVIAYEDGRTYVDRIGSGPAAEGGAGQGGQEQAERVPVEVLPYGRNMVRVISGLEPGDRLKAQAPGQGLDSGMSVIF